MNRRYTLAGVGLVALLATSLAFAGGGKGKGDKGGNCNKGGKGNISLVDEKKDDAKKAEATPQDRPQRGQGGRGQGGRGQGGFQGGFGRTQPGQILSPFQKEALKLNDDQKKQLEALQKEVDEKLSKILTEDQKKQLKEMGTFGGFGGGRGGFGRPMGGGQGGRGGRPDSNRPVRPPQ